LDSSSDDYRRPMNWSVPMDGDIHPTGELIAGLKEGTFIIFSLPGINFSYF